MRCFALMALVCAVAVSTTDAQTDFENRIAQIEKETGSRIGVVAIDPRTDRRVEHRSNELCLMCETFELLAAAAVLERIDRKEENLDRFAGYTQTDTHEYAPLTKQHVAQGGMKHVALCEAASEQRDNTAGNLLL